MTPIETVKIKGDVKAGEPAVIIVNKEDFDEKVHELTSDKDIAAAEKEVAATAAATAPEPDDEAKLRKMKKAELVTLATERGIEVVPDEVTIGQLIDKILGR